MTDYKSKALPEEYARLLQYVDCLIAPEITIYNGPEKAQKLRYVDDSSYVSRLMQRLKHEPQPEFKYDPRLDNFNRWCSLYLYLNYLANLDHDSEQQDKVAALKADISDYPSFMQPTIANFSVMN